MKYSFLDILFLKKLYQKKKIINFFKEKSAINIELAIKLNDFNRNDFPIINEMIREKTIVKVGFEDLYYLDEKKVMEKHLNKIKWAMIALLAIIILLFKKNM